MSDKTEILSEVKALSSHYPRRQLGQADQLRWLEDYAGDLASYSAADVRLACAQWRVSTEKRMPTPGELVAKCRSTAKPGYVATILPVPPPPEHSVEHKQAMQSALHELARDIAYKKVMRGPIQRLPSETEVDQAKRLWPSHQVVR